VDLSLSPEDLAFRDEVRRFLADNVRPGMGRAIDLTTAFIVDPDVLIDFHRALDRKGWSVPHWPVEHGGTGWSPVQAADRSPRKCLLSRVSSGAASADCAVDQRGSNAGRIRRLTTSGRHAFPDATTDASLIEILTYCRARA
jgi:alkylation response protein AidB-like acyl-CoA dehydrogenase